MLRRWAPQRTRRAWRRAWAVTYKREVGGQVTVAGSAAPAPGITMNACCPSGGTTTTDTNGYYEFLLDKGPCTIAPQLKPGDDRHVPCGG